MADHEILKCHVLGNRSIQRVHQELEAALLPGARDDTGNLDARTSSRVDEFVILERIPVVDTVAKMSGFLPLPLRRLACNEGDPCPVYRDRGGTAQAMAVLTALTEVD
ncbi:hypothetical protein [Rhizobium leguminosarum]|uniref:hypothetical protein n=1 Tax=Rhizobium leguminosarum TaxID=384 RepID=UPI003F9AEDE4